MEKENLLYWEAKVADLERRGLLVRARRAKPKGTQLHPARAKAGSSIVETLLAEREEGR